MPTLGVNIAILQENKVLLTQREDFEVWCLPGGGVDPGESIADAARREAREETGYEVELLRLVGVYSRPNWHSEGSQIALFTARILGGELSLQPGEVINAGFYSPGEIPAPLLFGQKQRVKDIFSGACGVVWTQAARWPFSKNMTRNELYAYRDQSGLTRQDFYLHYFTNLDEQGDILEFAGCHLVDI